MSPHHRRAPRGIAAAFAATLALAAPAGAQQQPSGPAAWRTWVLASGAQFRLPPPPDEAATRAELDRLRALVATRDGEAMERIGWWNAAAPSYRWNQIAMEESLRAGMPVHAAVRRLALLHTAIADAMVATWDSKQAHDRRGPAARDASLAAIAAPAAPSYPDEHAVAAAVASAVLSDVFPQRAAEMQRLADEAARMRLLAGVAFPSDVEAGLALGRQVAAAALERGRQDGSDRPWDGSVPAGAGQWNGTNPVMPQAATWRPWLLASPSEFRPAPPPAHDSAQRAAELQELRDWRRTPLSNARALFWEAAVGGLRIHEYWNNHASRLLMEHGQASDAARAARVFALLNVALFDVGVACWDAKYAYWTIRPSQLDRSFTTVFTPPNHPSYPAAHACFSMTAAEVLSHLFPRESATMATLAQESGDSRIWAGIHYRSDVQAGQALARSVAARVAERARSDGAHADRR